MEDISRGKYGGFILRDYLCDPKSIYFYNFGVFPEYQGKGYGRRLFNVAMRRAKRMGYSHLWFYVDNPDVNIPIYKKFGATLHETSGRAVMSVDLDSWRRQLSEILNDPRLYRLMKAWHCTIENVGTPSDKQLDYFLGDVSEVLDSGEYSIVINGVLCEANRQTQLSERDKAMLRFLPHDMAIRQFRASVNSHQTQFNMAQGYLYGK